MPKVIVIASIESGYFPSSCSGKHVSLADFSIRLERIHDFQRADFKRLLEQISRGRYSRLLHHPLGSRCGVNDPAISEDSDDNADANGENQSCNSMVHNSLVNSQNLVCLQTQLPLRVPQAEIHGGRLPL